MVRPPLNYQCPDIFRWSESGLTHFISPAGEVHDTLETVLQRTQPDSDRPLHTPKKRKSSNLTDNSAVIRKMTPLSPKKAKIQTDDIDDLLLESDPEL